MRSILTALFTFILFLQSVTSQTIKEDNGLNTRNIMEENGKMYVVLVVCLLIFAGIVFFLYRIEKRISEIEKRNQ